MSLGTKGAEVKALQVALNSLGYAVAVRGAGSRGSETDFFGPGTERALRSYKSANGLGNAGDIDFGTRTKLNAIKQCGTIISISSASFARNLNVGSRGDDVKRLQTYLASMPGIYPEKLVTGTYGSLTRAAVGRFQAFYSIARPGEAGYGTVGPKTRAKLNEVIR
jgi:peptidoglycan hydrolase-like protein with peptidoglycan-binding domain